MHTQLLLISCADKAGLVYKISGVLYRHAANIISNHEFVDRDAGQFFMRTAFTGRMIRRRCSPNCGPRCCEAG